MSYKSSGIGYVHITVNLHVAPASKRKKIHNLIKQAIYGKKVLKGIITANNHPGFILLKPRQYKMDYDWPLWL